MSLLNAYGVIPEEEKKLYGQESSSITEPAKRRETKIVQFKKEKEIKNNIAVRQVYLFSFPFCLDSLVGVEG